MNIYTKLESYPPNLKNLDRWVEQLRIKEQRELERRKQMERHVANLR